MGREHNALIPELAVTDWLKSRAFYCDLIGFHVVYERPHEGFAFLALGGAQLMIDQVGAGRTFDIDGAPRSHPFGRGINLQIAVPSIAPVLEGLKTAAIELYLPVEEKWYERDGTEQGMRQFIVADPDGYLLRLFEHIGERPSAVIH